MPLTQAIIFQKKNNWVTWGCRNKTKGVHFSASAIVPFAVRPIKPRTSKRSLYHLCGSISEQCKRCSLSEVDLWNGQYNSSPEFGQQMRSTRVLVFESSFKWHTFLYLMLFHSNSAHFSDIQLVCDRRTDGPKDGPTDGPTDGRTHPLINRDARTHLKRRNEEM